MVHYSSIDGEKVSAQWYVVLRRMRRDGVTFNVNEGHRTWARQAHFYALYRAGRGNLAAVPSANAPHIRTGRPDHAVDFGNDMAVFQWLQENSLRPVRTVRGESWHIEVSALALVDFSRRHSLLLRLGPKRQKAARTLLARRRKRADEARSRKGPRWIRANWMVKRSYRKVYKQWRRAQPGTQKRILKKVLRDTNGVVD